MTNVDGDVFDATVDADFSCCRLFALDVDFRFCDVADDDPDGKSMTPTVKRFFSGRGFARTGIDVDVSVINFVDV